MASCRARVIAESYNRTAPRTPYRGASHRPHRAKGEPWPGIHTGRPTRHNRPQIRRHSLADHLSRFHHIALLIRFYHITPSHHTMRSHRGASPRKPFPSRPASQPRARYDVSSCRVSCAHRVSRAVYCMRLHVPVQDARAEERRPYVHRSTVGAVSPRAPRRLCKPTKRMITCSVTTMCRTRFYSM